MSMISLGLPILFELYPSVGSGPVSVAQKFTETGDCIYESVYDCVGRNSNRDGALTRAAKLPFTRHLEVELTLGNADCTSPSISLHFFSTHSALAQPTQQYRQDVGEHPRINPHQCRSPFPSPSEKSAHSKHGRRPAIRTSRSTFRQSRPRHRAALRSSTAPCRCASRDRSECARFIGGCRERRIPRLQSESAARV